MLPLLVLAALAAYALGHQKDKDKAPPAGTSGGATPPTGPVVTIPGLPTLQLPTIPGVSPGTTSSTTFSLCELDSSVQGFERDTVLGLLNQAQTAQDAATASVLSGAMETTATVKEMEGKPKTAACLRQTAKALRGRWQLGAQFTPSGVPVQTSLGVIAPISYTDLAKPKA